MAYLRVALAALLLVFLVGCEKASTKPAPSPEHNSADEVVERLPVDGTAANPAPTSQRDSTRGAIQLPDGLAIRVLFVGNSLTAWNDVPGMVQAMATAGKVRLEYRDVTMGGANLEDHWNTGNAPRALKSEKWQFVVLQQGPSTLPESQADLKLWSGRWAEEIRKHGAEPALYMVWSFRTQKNGLALASQSYRAAATACRAKILPAGDAWREAFAADPEAPLYAENDDLHANETGSYLAALVITHGLTGIHPSVVPDELTLMSGHKVTIPAPTAAKLRAAAEKVVGPPAKPQK